MQQIDLLIKAEEMVKAAGWRVANSHTAQSGSFYFDAQKLDADGYEVEDANGDIIEFSVRVSTHSAQSTCNGRIGGVAVNVFDKTGLEILAEKLTG